MPWLSSRWPALVDRFVLPAARRHRREPCTRASERNADHAIAAHGAHATPRLANNEVLPSRMSRNAHRSTSTTSARRRRPGSLRLRRIARHHAQEVRARTSSTSTPHGKPIKDRQTLDRIRMLAIPPAYRDVWICPDAHGHIQAVGRDDRGRKQYRYHAKWREVRDENKYDRMIDFAKALPKIRRTVAQRPEASRPAAREGAGGRREVHGDDAHPRRQRRVREEQQLYGLTTLAGPPREVLRAARCSWSSAARAASSTRSRSTTRGSPRSSGSARTCPGRSCSSTSTRTGDVRDIGSADVNEYLREITGEDFTAKDFRTWAGTVLAATALQEIEKFDSEAQAKKNIVRAVEVGRRRSWATPRRSAASVTSTRRSSTRTWTARWSTNLAKQAAKMAKSLAQAAAGGGGRAGAAAAPAGGGEEGARRPRRRSVKRSAAAEPQAGCARRLTGRAAASQGVINVASRASHLRRKPRDARLPRFCTR